MIKDSCATQQNSGSTMALSSTASILTSGAIRIDAGRDPVALAGKLRQTGRCRVRKTVRTVEGQVERGRV